MRVFLRAILAGLRLTWASVERDVVTFGGLGAVCYGVAQVHEPAAWIVGGCALFWLGVRGA